MNGAVAPAVAQQSSIPSMRPLLWGLLEQAPLPQTHAGPVSAAAQVEPFNRALNELQADVMINGRRRDHGAERAQLEVRLPLSPAPAPVLWGLQLGAALLASGSSCAGCQLAVGTVQEFEDGHPVKCNALAWWTFKDCFDYLDRCVPVACHSL